MLELNFRNVQTSLPFNRLDDGIYRGAAITGDSVLFHSPDAEVSVTTVSGPARMQAVKFTSEGTGAISESLKVPGLYVFNVQVGSRTIRTEAVVFPEVALNHGQLVGSGHRPRTVAERRTILHSVAHDVVRGAANTVLDNEKFWWSAALLGGDPENSVSFQLYGGGA